MPTFSAEFPFSEGHAPLQTMLDYIKGGQSLNEFPDDFPTVGRETAIAALERAKSLPVDQLG